MALNLFSEMLMDIKNYVLFISIFSMINVLNLRFVF